LGDGELLLSDGRGTRGQGAQVTGVGSVRAQRAEPMGSPAGVSWARVVAGKDAAQSEAQGLTPLPSVVGREGVEQAEHGAADVGGRRLTTGLTAGVDVAVAPPGAQRTERSGDRQPKRGQGNGTSQTVKAACYDCAWLSLTALSTVTCNLWL
jgi:hypothetical protein